MKNDIIKNKTKILAFTMASFMATSSFGLAVNGLVKSKLIKDTVEAYSSELSISNNNFTNPSISSSTTLPVSPNSWTEIEKPENVTAGVITLDNSIATTDKITNSYKLSGNLPTDGGLEDKQVLMLNASTGSATAGYKSGQLTLSASSYYVIRFKAFCNSSTFGSARITGSSQLEKFDTTLSVSTNGVWQEYKIFIKTSSITSTNANLELWLGNATDKNKSSGAIFFDDVYATSYDNATFELALQNSKTANEKYKFVNLDREYLTSGPKNSSFESALSEDNWTLSENNTLHSATETINGRFDVENHNGTHTEVTDEIKNSNVYNNRYALLINNKESGSVGYKSSYFTIKSKELYKLSFIVKTGKLENGATVKLVERNPYTNPKLSDGVSDNPYYYKNSSFEARTFTMSDIKTNDYTNEFTNGWKEYSFYIKGHSLVDTEVNLELWLGTSEKAEKGYVFFDEFKIQNLTTSEYDSNSSTGTVANLSQDTKETDFKNAAFNLVEISDVNNGYPYAPLNWTLESSQSTGVKNGVINTANDNFAIGVPVIQALEDYSNNNVLMIGNISSNNQKYTSSQLTIPANTYSKITVKVLTTELNGAKAGIRVISDGVILGEIMNIDTGALWKTYTLFIKTGYEEKIISLELSLGENLEGTGYAFFDNVKYNDSLTADDYKELDADKKIDLSKNDWSNIPAKSTATQGLYKPYGWTANYDNETDLGAITAGVIDTINYGDTEIGYYESSFASPEHPEGEGSKVLMIKATNDSYYTYKTVSTSALSNGSYYKISVYVKTDGIGQIEENIKYKDSKNTTPYPYGATINIDGIDAEFTGINTEGQWKLYTMYINSTTDSNIALELSLGNENAKTHGAVYFSSTSIEKIEEEEYVNGIKALENSSVDNILAVGDTDVDNEEDKEEDKQDSGEVSFNWLLVPSIITGLAILAAVIGVIWRNYRKKSHKKPKIQKPYSKENYKRLLEQHKIELGQIKEQKTKLITKQNSLAIELNKAKAEKSENVDKLEKEYAELAKKLEKVEAKKQESNKKYKQRVEDLKAMEKAERR
ncbi:MAG TPA: hypothetical protein DCO89_00780 [Clostridiales bacterium]|nr:hypothetical protein [Clostridiales bacterium]